MGSAYCFCWLSNGSPPFSTVRYRLNKPCTSYTSLIRSLSGGTQRETEREGERERERESENRPGQGVCCCETHKRLPQGAIRCVRWTTNRVFLARSAWSHWTLLQLRPWAMSLSPAGADPGSKYLWMESEKRVLAFAFACFLGLMGGFWASRWVFDFHSASCHGGQITEFAQQCLSVCEVSMQNYMSVAKELASSMVLGWGAERCQLWVVGDRKEGSVIGYSSVASWKILPGLTSPGGVVCLLCLLLCGWPGGLMPNRGGGGCWGSSSKAGPRTIC